MAVENIATDTLATIDAKPTARVDVRKGGGRVRLFTGTLEVDAAASINSTYHLARLPSDAVILDRSQLIHDDLQTTGAPTFDIGVFNLPGETRITDDDDAINDGITIAAAGAPSILKTPVDQANKFLWEHVAGQTVDPGGLLDVKITLKDVAIDLGGTVTVELYYVSDG